VPFLTRIKRKLLNYMGSTASISPADSNTADEESLQSVYKFADMALENGKKSDTMKAILTNADGRRAFVEFLRSERASLLPCLKPPHRVESALDLSSLGPTDEGHAFGYILPSTETPILESNISPFSRSVAQLLSGEREYSNDEIVAMLERFKDETIVLTALDALPRFLKSNEYKKWRDTVAQRAVIVTSSASKVNVTIPEILAADPNLIEGKIVQAEAVYSKQNIIAELFQPSSPKKSSCVKIFDNVEVKEVTGSTLEEDNDPVDQALKHIDYLEIDRILRSGTWLFTFVAAVENIPMCITLSTARKDRIGFPLIYVNRYFEDMSGYSRSDIMGANCKFLQRDMYGITRAEPESVQRISFALRSAEPVKVAITNFRRDGTPFRNLLAIKPVFDQHGAYQYVIGVQFNISENSSSSLSLRMVDNFMKLLPGVVVN